MRKAAVASVVNRVADRQAGSMKARAACLAGLVVVLLSSVVVAAAPPRNLDELRARVARVLLRANIPGAGIALVDGQQILWAGGVGVADRASGRPVTADTLFRIGSITKSFVALALVKLAEQGRVDLNARVSDLAPELQIRNRWDAEQPITVAHLLEWPALAPGTRNRSPPSGTSSTGGPAAGTRRA
jgi:CubicO group peptidase (beta-lactamase class C family)